MYSILCIFSAIITSFITTTSGSAVSPRSPIPIIDIRNFFFGNSSEQQNVAREVGSALEGIGLALIINHGISQDNINSAFKMIRSFFDKDLKYKQKFGRNPSMSEFSRYKSIGEEILIGKHPDYKESYDFNFHDLLPLINSNQFPFIDDMETFNKFSISMRSTLSTIAQIISLSLNGERFHISNLIDSSLNSLLRFVHYPPTPKHNDTFKSPALGPHTDYYPIAIGFQDSSQGFEAWDKLNKRWVPIPHIPGGLLFNLGDVMQRWSNDKYTATFHRMKSAEKDRYIMYLFSAPDMNTIIDPKDFLHQNETNQLCHEQATVNEIITHRMQKLYTGQERKDQLLGDLEALKY